MGHSFDILTFDFLLKPPQPITGLFLQSGLFDASDRAKGCAENGSHVHLLVYMVVNCDTCSIFGH